MSAVQRRVFRLLLTVAIVYLAACCAMYLAQDRMLFPLLDRGRTIALPSLPGVSIEWLTLADGSRVRAAVAAPAKPRAWLVFFCGNGEDLRSGVHWATGWRAYDVGVVVAEYPGYGDSDGRPNADSLRAMAAAAAEFARARAQRDGVPLIAAGASLGSFAAVQMAASGVASRLLLLAPFSSVRDVACARYWFLPTALLLRHELDNMVAAAAVQVPAFVLHGDEDEVIALHFGEKLARALRARLVVAPGCGHNDLPVDRNGPFGKALYGFLHGE